MANAENAAGTGTAYATRAAGLSLPFTDSHSVSGTYHVWQGGIPADGAAGLVLYFHGDGAFEHLNPSFNYGMYGNRGLPQVANAKGYIFVSALSPDVTGTVTWWESGAQNSDYAADLLQHLITAYNINTNRVWLSGYSGGAVFITEWFLPEYSSLILGGGAVIIGGGNVPNAGATNNGFSSGFKSSFEMHWLTGAQDEGTYTGDGYDAIGAATAGKAYYQGQGFATAELTSPLGHGHELDGAFGPLLDNYLPVLPGYSVPSTTAGAVRPSLIASQLVTGTATGTLTATAFTPAPGEVILLKLWNDDLNSPNIDAIGPDDLTWATIQHTQFTGFSECWIFTATVPPGWTKSITPAVSFFGTGGAHGMVLERWQDAQVRASQTSGPSPTHATGAPSATATPSTDHSVLSWVVADFAVIAGTATYRSSAVETRQTNQTSVRAYAAYQNPSAATSQTMGLSAPTGQTWTLAAVELVPAADAGTNVSAGNAAGTGTAYGAAPNVNASAGNAAGTGTAYDATVAADGYTDTYGDSYGAADAAGNAAGTGTAYDATIPGGASVTRLLGPDAGSRLVYIPSGPALRSAAGTSAVVYTDAAGTTLADIASYDGTGTPGPSIGGSQITVDTSSQLPLFWFPDGVDTVYVAANGGPVSKVNADYDARIDAGGGGGGAVTSVAGRTGAVTLGESDITNLTTDLAAKVAKSTVTTKGDLLAATASATVARLGVGPDGQMLYADSTQTTGIKWAAAPSGTGIPPTIVDVKGDLIAASAADTVVRLAVGTNGQVLTADSTQTTGLVWATPSGGGGGSGTLPSTIFVAASTASAAEKTLATATYTCDGTADDVQIQAAITAIKAAGGGTVQLSAGTFNLAARILLEGVDDVDIEVDVALCGAGVSSTDLVAASGLASAVHLAKVVKARLSDFRVTVIGASHGFSSTATLTSTAGFRSFWLSEFRNLQVVGPFDGTHTGYAFHFDAPFRSVFSNLEAAGIGNGVRLYSTSNSFNPGDCQFTRCFMDLVGNSRFGYKIESTVANGNINQIQFSMIEAIASGTGCTGIYLGGTGPVNHMIMTGVNLEQFDFAFQVNNGEGNEIEMNYVEIRAAATGAAGSLIRFDTAAKNNWVRRVGFMFSNAAHRLITSTATDTTQPNLVEHVKVLADTGATITNSIGTAGAVIRKWTVAEGAGTATGVTVTPA